MTSFKVSRQNDLHVLIIEGELTIHEVERITKQICEEVERLPKAGVLEIDLSKTTQMDTVGTGLLSLIKRTAERRNIRVKLSPCSAEIQHVIDRFLWLETPVKKPWTLGDWLEETGDKAIKLKDRGVELLQLMADTVIFSIFEDKRTHSVRKGAVWQEANQIGLGALGIISLMTLLVGAVVALQTASLLRLFGADIMVADMIGIAMIRELAPLMTAIIMAGRSGASIAAEIATMSINEEIAGIRTMGLDPIRYVVVPKFRAITLTMPGLTVFAMVFGILGGFLIAILYMGLSPSAFWHELWHVVFIKDILVTLLKSTVMAWIIVWVAAHQGFSAYGGSEAVGRVTTQSVVLSIFWCIIADAISSMIFYF